MEKLGIDFTRNDREAIRLYRLAAHKSRESVAEAIGRSARWIARIEKGGSATLTAVDLFRMARALDIAPEDLISGR